ncbi:hypothetical protein TNCV_488101 [Trichonephila clavipes]|nr:hypothetical protein TNCV_488101 [Trichonephila clavipes]
MQTWKKIDFLEIDVLDLDFFLNRFIRLRFESIKNRSFSERIAIPSYGHELVANVPGVRALVQLKTHLIEGPMHVKSIEGQSPPVGVVGSFQHGLPAEVSSSSFDRGLHSFT